MIKNMRKIISIIILEVLILNLLFPIMSVATEDVVTIIFKDENLYNAIVDALGDKIESKVDVDKTINMTQSNLETVTELTVKGKGIANIEGLEKLTNLTHLDLRENRITDIKPLEELTKIWELNLGNNQIENIEPLRGLTKIWELNLSNNQIENIDSLYELKGLGLLDLKNNQIKNIEPLYRLKNLGRLELQNNQIENIEPLEELTNLNLLYLENNQIENIEPLRGLTKIWELNLSNNQIENIDPLYKLTNLQALNLENNKISDFLGLERMNNLNLECRAQILETLTNQKEVKLPTVFMQVQNKYSIMYTSLEAFELVNCSLSEDKDKVILDDDIETATVKIVYGKCHDTKLTINYRDNIPPTLDVQYSTKELTKETVTTTIKANERIQQVEGWTLSEDGTTLSKRYAKNTTEKVKVYDLAGNESEAEITINNIDKTVPQAEIKYSTTKLTNQNVVATIITDEQIKDVKGWTLSNDKLTLTKEFENNAEEEVSIFDLVGNERKLSIKVSNIDKIAPITEITYSTKETTNGNVQVTIIANEEIQEVEGWIISSDRKKLVKDYEENVDKEEVVVYDLANNSTKNEITISNIDKSKPELPKEDVSGEKEDTTIAPGDKDDTIAPSVIPKAGREVLIIMSIVFAVVITIALGRKNNKFRDIK